MERTHGHCGARKGNEEREKKVLVHVLAPRYKGQNELFGKERTDKELEDYLKFDFFERCGGGIGVTRLMRSMKKENLI